MKHISFLVLILASFTLLASACASTNTPTNSAASAQNTTMNTVLPTIPPAKQFQHQLPAEFTLNNGIRVWYIHNPIVPLMSLKLSFESGSYMDPIDKAGLAALTSAMLKEGSNGRSAQAVSDDIEMIGASLYTSTSQDSISIDLQVMTQYFESGLDILENIWQHPDFTPQAYERLLKIWKTNLVSREDAPEQLAKLAGNRDFFGDTHPYAISTDGYLDTIPNITLDDVKAQYEVAFAPANATIIATGNLPADEVKALLNARFGSLDTTPKPLPPCVIPPYTPTQRVTIVDKPGAAQTIIRIALPSVKSDDPRLLNLKLVNIPFGASFTSRLMQNIREDKGYTYGAYASIAALKNDGFLIANAAVASDVTGPALKEFLYELDQLTQGNFTEEEFERAKATWQSELVQTFETQSGVISILTGLALNHHAPDKINKFAQSLPTLTLDQFNALAQTFPKLNQASITLVGDKDLILDQIKDLGLPEPTFRDNQGRLIQ